MRIYKETSSDKLVKIHEDDFNKIIFDVETLCNKLHSYCTSNNSYSKVSGIIDKEG